jgi:hypothetical protein
LEEALQTLEPAEQDLERLRAKMNIVAEYWSGVDTELQDMEARVKTLRQDHMLQMRVRGLSRRWKDVGKDHKNYIAAVSAVHA